jgi:hypothetical protein
MKKNGLILLVLLTLLRSSLFAQNIYEGIGKTAEILTLSNGKYQEIFPNDTLVCIGTVLFNTVTNEVVDFIDSVHTEGASAADIASRFLSLDPIGREYPELTPYQFASNTPIMAIDLDGLEGVVFGSLKQVDAINKTPYLNLNYKAYPLVTIENATEVLKKYNMDMYYGEGKARVVYLQTHGSQGEVYVGAGADGVINTTPLSAGSNYTNDDKGIGSRDIEIYLGKDKDFKGWPESKEGTRPIVDALKELMSQIETEGTLILGGCLIGEAEEGDKFLENLYELSGKRINIVANQDYTADTRNGKDNKETVLDMGRTSKKDFTDGWKIIGPSTSGKVENKGKNLMLNSLDRTI